VMFPSLEQLAAECELPDLERELLCAPQAPIVLVRRRTVSGIAHGVAPGNPYLGVMLPYTPLHHLLMGAVGVPLVATSGNLAEEPICIDELEAVQRLAGLADLFLVHNRPIVRHADDSIVRVMAGRPVVLRRARGYAPLPVDVPSGSGGKAVLAVGAHLKNSIALAIGSNAFTSQHIGDLETAEACRAFERVIEDFQQFYEVQPEAVAADLHPDYLSTAYAERRGLPVIRVQHHYAHALACVAEHALEGEVLGIVWDGTGYGTDATIWGGEILVIHEHSFSRFAHLRTFRLPGGDRAVKEPRRSALGLLYELFGEGAFERLPRNLIEGFTASERGLLRQVLARGVQAPVTSSAGRLFDGVASLLGLCQQSAFEGQAAMNLEFALDGFETNESYSMPLQQREPGRPVVIDWGPAIEALLDDLRKHLPAGLLSTKFHHSLVDALVKAARLAGIERIVLSGGCFQNKYLLERAVLRLRAAGFQPYWHHLVPPNDGGIALGQVVAARRVSRSSQCV
jgi:hydrogenase maturation protein HypF